MCQIRQLKFGSKLIPYLQAELVNADGTSDTEVSSFILLTRQLVKSHFVVIAEKFDQIYVPLEGENLPEHPPVFYLAYFITHSGEERDNIKIKKEWITEFPLHSNSYITKRKFIIREKDIKRDKDYGYFDLFSYENELNQ